jgi:hypothetical protein
LKIGKKISESNKQYNAARTADEKQKCDAQLAAARDCLDRTKWAVAIDAGRKAYWTPECRAAKAEAMRGNNHAIGNPKP